MISRFFALSLLFVLAACVDGFPTHLPREQAYARTLNQVYTALSRDHVTPIDLTAFSQAGYAAVGLPLPAGTQLTQGQTVGQDLALRTDGHDGRDQGDALSTFIRAGLEATKGSARFTQYLTPADYQGFLSAVQGNAGIGVKLGPAVEGLVIEEIRPNSPAARAGLKPGEVIIAINGQLLSRIEGFEARLRLMGGSEGMPIELEISDIDTVRNVRTVRLIREAQSLNDFSPATRLGNIALIPLDIFDQRASSHIREELERLAAQGPIEGIILNLRNNSGGSVFETLQIADLFLGQGAPIFRYETREGSSLIRAQRPATVSRNLPVAVLINGDSASASEILAGSLLDARRAIVIGSVSFGKGTQQQLRRLANGGALTLTNAFIFRADGQEISFRGIIPQICTARSGSPRQVVSALNQGRQPALAQQAFSARSASQARALCPARAGSEAADLALAQAILTNPGAYEAALGL